MKALKYLLCAFAVFVLAACQDDEQQTSPKKETIKAEEMIVTPTHEEVISIVENFVDTIMNEAQALGGSDETPLNEAQLAQLNDTLTSVATEQLLTTQLNEVLPNLCYACDANPMPTFYYFGVENLAFENELVEDNTYAVDISYADEMIDSQIIESITLKFEDDVWKLDAYNFDYQPLSENSAPIEDVEVVTEEVEYDGEITKDSFVGEWQPFNAIEEEYVALADIYTDYYANISLHYGDYESGNYDGEWEGYLNFESDTVATLEIEQDGRPGLITLTANGYSIDFSFEFEDASNEAEFTPFTGQIDVNISFFRGIDLPYGNID